MKITRFRFAAATLIAILLLTGCNGGGGGTTSSSGASTPAPAPAPAPGTYTLSTAVTGSGTITSSPAGINCGATCSANFISGVNVTLTATPGSGYSFTGWSGACSGTATTCAVTMSAARSTNATFAVTPIPSGTIYYISNCQTGAQSGCIAGNDSNAGSTSSPFLTIQKGLSVLSPGNTLVIRDGTYAGSSNSMTNLPNGTPGNPITIQAENEGNAILTGGLSMAQGNQYLVFQGLRFHDTGQKAIVGHHIKFFRNEFKGGPATGNTVTVAIGTNDFTPGAQYILMEDNWVHGYGGRYKILVYNSDSIVLRRVVVRHDGRDPIMDSNPMGDITVYDSSNVEVQNAIAIDDMTGSTTNTYTAAFYNVCNNTTATPSTNHFRRGVMAINPKGYLMGTEGQCATSNLHVEDAVLFGGNFGVSQLSATNPQYRRLTIISPSGHGVGVYGGTGSSFSDIIVRGAGGRAFDGITPTNSVAFANAGGNTGGTIIDPFTNGLSYLPRIEAGSVLASGGTGGGQRGAQIVKRIGEPGTLYGETGYSATTTTDLWPFPNEARIKKEMCTDAGITRGFCATTGSLSAYIFSILGTASPYP